MIDMLKIGIIINLVILIITLMFDV